MNNPRILAFLTIILWSFGLYMGRLLSIKSQYLLLSLSFSMTFLTLLVYFIITNRGQALKKIRQIKTRYLFFGLFGYFFYWLGIFKSMKCFNSASEATVLNYTWPIFTVIFTGLFFRKEKDRDLTTSVIEGIGITIGFISVMMLATRGSLDFSGMNNIHGILWGLFGGMSYGLFSAYSSKIEGRDHSLFLLCAIFSSLVAMIILSPGEMHLLKTLTARDFFAVFFLGCIMDGLGYITWTRANRTALEQNIKITAITSIIYVLPLISLTIITILLKEYELFKPYFYISLFMIIFSSILCQKSDELKRYIRRGNTRVKQIEPVS